MAGRKAHIEEDKFNEFLASLPDEAKGAGFWRIKKELVQTNGGGVTHSFVGFIPFDMAEDYNGLRERIRFNFANNKGPGVYYALPCDMNKKEVKDKDMARFEFQQNEVDMPEPSANTNPLGDAIKAIKSASQSATELQTIDFQQKLMSKFLGGDKEEKKDESARETTATSPMNDFMLYRMMMDMDKKPVASTDTNTNQQLLDAKLAAALAEMRATVTAIQTQIHSQPKDDGKFERLLERLVEKENNSKQDQVLTIMLKQQEDRERMRLEEEKRRDEERRHQEEERHREEKERNEERRREDASKIEERRRYEEEKRREEAKREDDKRSFQLQLENEKKEERRRIDEQMKLERDKFEKQAAEERRRADEESKIRREEIKAEQEKARIQSTEQQKYQLQLFELVKDSKNSGLEMTTRVVDIMTNAGMNTMKTATDAADCIMSMAKKSNNGQEKEEGFGKILKDLGAVAGPLLAPYAESDAKLRMLKAAAKAGAGVMRPRPAQMQPPPQRQVPSQTAGEPSGLSGVSNVNQDVQDVSREPNKESYSMIAQYLKAYPILKEALIGNLQDGLGPECFVPVVTGLEQDTLEGLLANLPSNVLLRYIKEVCNEEEKKLVDANIDWFKKFRKIMIDILKSNDEDDEEPETKEQKPEVSPTTPAQANQ